MTKKLTDIEYNRIAHKLQLMKYIHGPGWVFDTLRRHKDIRLALLDYEESYIIDLESDLIKSE